MPEPTQITDLTHGVYKRIYDNFTRGKRICSVSEGAEAWFWRIFVKTDDFGNMLADPKACHSVCAGNRKISVKKVEKYLNELYNATLLTFYWVKDEKYLHIDRYEDMQRGGRNGRRVRRFPGMEDASANLVHPGNPVRIMIRIKNKIKIILKTSQGQSSDGLSSNSGKPFIIIRTRSLTKNENGPLIID